MKSLPSPQPSALRASAHFPSEPELSATCHFLSDLQITQRQLLLSEGLIVSDLQTPRRSWECVRTAQAGARSLSSPSWAALPGRNPAPLWLLPGGLDGWVNVSPLWRTLSHGRVPAGGGQSTLVWVSPLGPVAQLNLSFAEGPLESRVCVHDRLQIRGPWLCFLGASQPLVKMGPAELRAKGLTSEWDSIFLSPVPSRHQP